MAAQSGLPENYLQNSFRVGVAPTVSRSMWAYKRSARFVLLGFDLLMLLASIAVMHMWRVPGAEVQVFNRIETWFFSLSLLAFVYVFGAYEIERFPKTRECFHRVGVAIFLFGVVASLLVYLGVGERAGLFGRGVLYGSLTSFFFVSSATRYVLYKSLHQIQKKSSWVFAVSSHWVERLRKDLKHSRFKGNAIFLDETRLQDLPRHLQCYRAGLVVGFDRQVFESNTGIFMRVLEARLQGHEVMDITAFYERFWRKIPVTAIKPEWLVHNEGFRLFYTPMRSKLKRLFDWCLSLILLVVTWPIMLLAAIAIKLDSRGPVFYRQTRTGRDGYPFTIFKFRSMCNDAEKNGAQWACVGDARITRVGSFLRKTRIDELPQVFNVFRGEMSFVGPRPERPEFNEQLEKEIPYYRLRYLVAPGITGWAQILYPYGASTEDAWEKLQYDIFYIKNYSIWLDLKIALKTARVVILGRGR
jgi:exopolysaccharide biosynthesis polyprenyl glycosylphosphotransferase